MPNFEIVKPITLSKIIQCDACSESEKMEALKYVTHMYFVNDLNEEIIKEDLNKAFIDNPDWFDYAIDEGWVKKIHTEIDCNYVHRDSITGDLFDISMDDHLEILVLINLTRVESTIYKFSKFDDMEEEDQPSIEMISDECGIDLVNTGLALPDIILKKVLAGKK